jgi:hypothetical protein
MDPEASENIRNTNGWVPGLNDEVVRNPVRVIGNLTIDLRTTTTPSDESTTESIAVIEDLYEGLVEERDNTLYAPNYGTDPVTDTGPWIWIGTVAPRETYGVRHDGEASPRALTPSMTDNVSNNKVFDTDTSFATPHDGLTLYRPAPGAGVAGAATGPMSHRDFLGSERKDGQPASKGAIEPV